MTGRRYIVETRDHGTGRQRPSDTESDTEQCGGHQRTKGEIAVDVRFIQIKHATTGEGRARSPRSWPPASAAEQGRSTAERERRCRAKSRAGPVRKVWEQGTRHRQAHHLLAGRCRIRAHPSRPRRPVGGSVDCAPHAPQYAPAGTSVPHAPHVMVATPPSSAGGRVILALPRLDLEKVLREVVGVRRA